MWHRPIGPWLRRNRERHEAHQRLVREVWEEPWRAPEIGSHWVWCQLNADHAGRCHTRRCPHRRDHDGPCQVENLAVTAGGS